jgi:hypothetical protein
MNMTAALTLSQLKDIVQQSLAAIVPDDWARYCMHVQNNDKQ